MLTLKQVSDAIVQVQEQAGKGEDMPAIQQKIKDLFFFLLQQDSFYVITADKEAEGKAVKPYFAPVNSQNPAMYIRLFSHKEAAALFMAANQISDFVAVPLSGVESIQLAKFWMLRGVTGYMINDGGPWVAISFPDFLFMSFQDLLGRPEMYNEEYVHCMEFLISLKNGKKCYFRSGDGNIKVTEEPEEGDTEVDRQSILQLQDDCLVDLDGTVIPALSLIRAAREFIWQDNGDYCFKSTDYVNLDFAPDDKISLVPSEEEADTGEPAPQEERQEGEEKGSSLKSKTAWIRTLFRRQKKDGDRFHSPGGELNTAQPTGPDTADGSRKRKRIPIKWLAAAGGIATVFVLILASGIFRSDLSKLESALDDQDIGKSVSIYEKMENPYDANVLLEERIDAVIDQYAAGQLSEDDAKEQLAIYSRFPTVEDYMNGAEEDFAELKESKAYYQTGLQDMESGNVIQGLTAWEHVIEQDNSYQDIQNYLSQNEENLVLAGTMQCVQYIQQGNKGEYANGVQTLQKWFPGNEGLEKLEENPVSGTAGGSDRETGTGLTDVPVRITGVTIQKNAQQGVDLYIEWENASGKEIEQIIFTVEPHDENGRNLSCLKNGYSQYDAIAVGPYDVGEGMDYSRYWENVWYNSMITGVRLLRISIDYADGTTQFIINQQELSDMIE